MIFKFFARYDANDNENWIVITIVKYKIERYKVYFVIFRCSEEAAWSKSRFRIMNVGEWSDQRRRK